MPAVCTDDRRRWSKRAESKKNSVRTSRRLWKIKRTKKTLSIWTVHVHFGVVFLLAMIFGLTHSHRGECAHKNCRIWLFTHTKQLIMWMPPPPSARTKKFTFFYGFFARLVVFFFFTRPPAASTGTVIWIAVKIQKCRK